MPTIIKCSKQECETHTIGPYKDKKGYRRLRWCSRHDRHGESKHRMAWEKYYRNDVSKYVSLEKTKLVRESIEQTVDTERIKQLDKEPDSLLEGLDMIRAILLDHEMRIIALEHVVGIKGKRRN